MAHFESPNWTGPPPPPQRSTRMAFADWFARWGFALLTVFFLVLVAAALYLLPQMRKGDGPPVDPAQFESATSQAPEAKDLVYVSISSVPSGARLEIDVETIGRTPVYFQPIERGVHLLSLELEGYIRVDTLLYNQTQDTSSYVFVMRPDARWARPDTSTPVEQPPVTDPVLARQGDADARRDNPTDRTQRQNTPTPQRQAETRPTPPPGGTITVTSTPLGATVFVDGVDIGSTPTSLADVEEGAHQITVRLQGYNEYQTSVDVTPNQSSVVQAAMEPAAGELAILVKPWGSIFIDGRLAKRDIDIEFRTRLTAGEHAVVASHPTLGRITRTVRITAGGSQRIEFDLNEMNVSESQN